MEIWGINNFIHLLETYRFLMDNSPEISIILDGADRSVSLKKYMPIVHISFMKNASLHLFPALEASRFQFQPIWV